MKKIRPDSEIRRVALARQVIDYAIQAKWPQGQHITEQLLATKFRVSRSPVRAVLKLLESEGVVKSCPNQGFFLILSHGQLGRVKFQVPKTDEETLFQRLVSDRITGELPNTFTQAEIIRTYSVRRTILVRSLARMADYGLIVRNRGHGWSFAPTLDSVESREASYAFRSVVEPSAIRLPTLKIDHTCLTAARLQHLDLLEYIHHKSVNLGWTFDVDAKFHQMLANFSGNAFFANAIRQQNKLRRLLEFDTYWNFERVRDWCEEHLKIIESLERGRSDQASILLERHLKNAAERHTKYAE